MRDIMNEEIVSECEWDKIDYIYFSYFFFYRFVYL